MNCWKSTTVSILMMTAVSVAQAQQPFQGLPGMGAQPQQRAPLTDEQQQQIQAALQQAIDANAQGKAALEQGELDQAADKFDEAIKAASGAYQLAGVPQIEGIEDPRFESFFQKGRVLREFGYTKEALANIQQAGSFSSTVSDPEKLAAYIVEFCEVALEDQQFNVAIQTSQQGVRNFPKNAKIWFINGQAQFEYVKSQQYSPPQQIQEETQAAIEAFDRAIRIDPKYSEAYLERGNAHGFLQDFESAMEDFESAVEADPSNTDAVARLGSAAYTRGLTEANKRNGQRAAIERDLQNALAQFTSFLEQVPPREPGVEDDTEEIGHEDVLLQRAAVNVTIGDESPAGTAQVYYQNALNDALRVIELEPDAFNGYLQKGIAKRMLGDLNGALEALGEALDRSPNNPDALLRRGIILFRQGDYDRAAADLRTAILYTSDPRAHFWMGLCHSKQNELAKAVRHYSNAIKFRPNYAVARINRGLAYMRLGRFMQAKRDFLEVLRDNPSNSKARQLRDQAAQLATQAKMR